MSNGNGNGEEKEQVMITRTNVTTSHVNDTVELVVPPRTTTDSSSEMTLMAKGFDGRAEVEKMMEPLGPPPPTIFELVTENGNKVFVGTRTKVETDQNTGNSETITTNITLMAKGVDGRPGNLGGG